MYNCIWLRTATTTAQPSTAPGKGRHGSHQRRSLRCLRSATESSIPNKLGDCSPGGIHCQNRSFNSQASPAEQPSEACGALSVLNNTQDQAHITGCEEDNRVFLFTAAHISRQRDSADKNLPTKRCGDCVETNVQPPESTREQSYCCNLCDFRILLPLPIHYHRHLQRRPPNRYSLPPSPLIHQSCAGRCPRCPYTSCSSNNNHDFQTPQKSDYRVLASIISFPKEFLTVKSSVSKSKHYHRRYLSLLFKQFWILFICVTMLFVNSADATISASDSAPAYNSIVNNNTNNQLTVQRHHNSQQQQQLQQQQRRQCENRYRHERSPLTSLASPQSLVESVLISRDLGSRTDDPDGLSLSQKNHEPSFRSVGHHRSSKELICELSRFDNAHWYDMNNKSAWRNDTCCRTKPEAIRYQTTRCGEIHVAAVVGNEANTEEQCINTFHDMLTRDYWSRTFVGDFQSMLDRISCNQGCHTPEVLADDAYSLAANCSLCYNAYEDWMCTQMFGHLQNRTLKHLFGSCQKVAQYCPSLIPTDVHSGQPFHLCSGVGSKIALNDSFPNESFVSKLDEGGRPDTDVTRYSSDAVCCTNNGKLLILFCVFALSLLIDVLSSELQVAAAATPTVPSYVAVADVVVVSSFTSKASPTGPVLLLLLPQSNGRTDVISDEGQLSARFSELSVVDPRSPALSCTNLDHRQTCDATMHRDAGKPGHQESSETALLILMMMDCSFETPTPRSTNSIRRLLLLHWIRLSLLSDRHQSKSGTSAWYSSLIVSLFFDVGPFPQSFFHLLLFRTFLLLARCVYCFMMMITIIIIIIMIIIRWSSATKKLDRRLVMMMMMMITPIGSRQSDRSQYLITMSDRILLLMRLVFARRRPTLLPQLKDVVKRIYLTRHLQSQCTPLDNFFCFDDEILI